MNDLFTGILMGFAVGLNAGLWIMFEIKRKSR